MSYAELYEYCQTLTPPISRNLIVPKACELAKQAKNIRIIMSALNTEHIRGYFVWPDSGQDNQFTKFSEGLPFIVIGRGMNRCWTRFVIVKELMHLFDESLEKVGNGDEFSSLLNEFTVSEVEPSPAMRSETKGFWMALALLCPEELRQDFMKKRQRDEMSNLDIAKELKIPEQFVPSLFHPNYKAVISMLLG
jgi:Zn-dependent peptidase ImmA (M78 family)